MLYSLLKWSFPFEWALKENLPANSVSFVNWIRTDKVSFFFTYLLMDNTELESFYKNNWGNKQQSVLSSKNKNNKFARSFRIESISARRITNEIQLFSIVSFFSKYDIEFNDRIWCSLLKVFFLYIIQCVYTFWHSPSHHAPQTEDIFFLLVLTVSVDSVPPHDLLLFVVVWAMDRVTVHLFVD